MVRSRSLALSLLIVPGMLMSQQQRVPTVAGKSVVYAPNAAAATSQPLATTTALAVMQRGGNAIDAVVTAAAVLGVTEPFSCGIGGGGFMVVYRADTGAVTTIDHREAAPAAMHPRSFQVDGTPLPFNDARYSGLSAGVPGTVRGWELALARYGTMSLADVLGPAVDVARDGFLVDQVFQMQVQAKARYFDDVSSSERLYLDPDGTAPDVDELQADLDEEEQARLPEQVRVRMAKLKTLQDSGIDAYPVGEAPISGADAKSLARAIRGRGRIVPGVVPSAKALPCVLPDVLHDGDLLILMGAGDIGAVAQELATKGLGGGDKA